MTAFEWPVCVAPDCTRRINPDEHSFRCGEHRGVAPGHRQVIATVDEAVQAVEQLDAASAWRVLARLAEQYPTAVWQAATADLADHSPEPAS